MQRARRRRGSVERERRCASARMPTSRTACTPSVDPRLSPVVGSWRSDSGRLYDAVAVGDSVEFRVRDPAELAGQTYSPGEPRLVLRALAGEPAFAVEDRLRPFAPDGHVFDPARRRAACTSVARRPGGRCARASKVRACAWGWRALADARDVQAGRHARDRSREPRRRDGVADRKRARSARSPASTSNRWAPRAMPAPRGHRALVIPRDGDAPVEPLRVRGPAERTRREPMRFRTGRVDVGVLRSCARITHPKRTGAARGRLLPPPSPLPGCRVSVSAAASAGVGCAAPPRAPPDDSGKATARAPSRAAARRPASAPA